MQTNWVKVVAIGMETIENTAGKGKNANEQYSTQ